MSSETPYLVEQRDRQAQLAVPRPVHGRPTMSSGVEPQTSADVEVIGQWLEALGLISADEETGSLPEILADGTVLCRLANRIKPRSVENTDYRQTGPALQGNVQKFLNVCKSLEVNKTFDVVDLTEHGDFGKVLLALRDLYDKAAQYGIGHQFTRHLSQKKKSSGHAPASSATVVNESEEQEETDTTTEHIVKAIYSFKGADADELSFGKGDLITVTKVVDGGWWEGTCNGRSGWFPGNHVVELSAEEAAATSRELAADKGDSVQVYHNLVVQNMVDNERAYVQGLKTLLVTYLNPLREANVLPPELVSTLMGNLADICTFQDSFFSALEKHTRLNTSKQLLGQFFLRHASEMEILYSSYVANHPRAVAVLTDNSDKLSAYMESRGAPSPGMFTLTVNLSKPLRRLEKYPAELMELGRQMPDKHADKENVGKAQDVYNQVMTRTQELRRKKDIELEMVSNSVYGWPGKNLLDLGECACMVQVNHLASDGEVVDRFYLVFSGVLIVLSVGQSLNGYELKANYPLSAVQVQKGVDTPEWPNAIEIHLPQGNQGTASVVRSSLQTESDRDKFLKTIELCSSSQPSSNLPVRSRLGSLGSGAPRKGSRGSLAGQYQRSTSRFRRKDTPISRSLHWGFKSLRPNAPLTSAQLLAVKEHSQSPKQLRKFIYVGSKKRRQSRIALEAEQELKKSGENDALLLRIIDSYLQSGPSSTYPITDLSSASSPMMVRTASDSKFWAGRPGSKLKSHAQSFDNGIEGLPSGLLASTKDSKRRRSLKAAISNPYPNTAPPPTQRKTIGKW